MKIVFVNRFFFPDESATSQILSDLAFGLVERQADVHVVTSRQLYENSAARLMSQEIVNGVIVHRVWSTTFGRSSLFGRALDYLTFYLSAFFCLLRCVSRSTIVVTKTDPPLMSVFAAVAAKVKRGVLVNWLQDIFPEVAVSAGVTMLQGSLGRMLTSLRNYSLKNAVANVVIGQRMKELITRCGVNEGKVFVIQNWASESDIRPVPREFNPMRIGWGLENKFVVMYSGNLGRVHEYDTILNSAVELKNDSRVVFLFVGGGGLRSAFGKAVQDAGLKNVMFMPYQPREALAQSLSVGDLHLISLRKEFEGLVVPSKFYGILAAGRAAVFIGDKDGELVRLIERGQCGASVEEGDSMKLATVIRDYCADSEKLKTLGRNGRLFFDRELTRESAVRSWYALLTNNFN